MARRAPEGGSGGGRPVPPLPRSLVLAGGAVEGEVMLRELPAEVATTVWETFCHLRTWALTPPARRGELFRTGSQQRREISLLYETFDLDLIAPLAVLVRGMIPGEEMPPSEMSWACSCMADWAVGREAKGTALAFMELAALSAPENPGAAYVAGRLFRSYGEFRQAERWLQRARAVAWRVENWEVHALALNSLGNMLVEQGSFARAKGLLEKALKSARRNKLRRVEGEVLHDLFVVAVATERVKEAERYAPQVFEIYTEEDHPRMPQLAHDVAFFWITQGYFLRAFHVLQGLASHFDKPDERIRVIASTARAAGACGRLESFQRCWIDALHTIDRLQTRALLASSLVDIGLGASSLSQWEHAKEALERGTLVAEERDEADVLARAEAALSAVANQRSADLIPCRTSTVVQAADILAEEFVRVLQALAVDAGGKTG